MSCEKSAQPCHSRRCLLWAAIFAILAAGSFFLDGPVRAWVLAHPLEGLNPIARTISKFLDWPWLMVASAFCLGVAWLRRDRAFAKLIVAMIISSTLAGIIANASRLTTGRTRPRADVAQGWYGPWHNGQLLIGKSKYNAFPSGNTATAVGFAAILLFTRRKFWLDLLINAGALTVGWSRIYLGAHHFSDVIVATILGGLTARWVWLEWQERLDRWVTIGFARTGLPAPTSPPQ